MPPIVLWTVFNPLITFLVGFVIGNILTDKKIKWVVGVILFTAFHLFIVFVNRLDFADVSTWIYLILYNITGFVGIQLAAFRKKKYS